MSFGEEQNDVEQPHLEIPRAERGLRIENPFRIRGDSHDKEIMPDSS